jgi:hypothetical protein
MDDGGDRRNGSRSSSRGRSRSRSGSPSPLPGKRAGNASCRSISLVVHALHNAMFVNYMIV